MYFSCWDDQRPLGAAQRRAAPNRSTLAQHIASYLKPIRCRWVCITGIIYSPLFQPPRIAHSCGSACTLLPVAHLTNCQIYMRRPHAGARLTRCQMPSWSKSPHRRLSAPLQFVFVLVSLFLHPFRGDIYFLPPYLALRPKSNGIYLYLTMCLHISSPSSLPFRVLRMLPYAPYSQLSQIENPKMHYSRS